MHLRGLHERELRVAGARRHVHEEVVKLSPRHVLQELREDLHHDRAAPDGRLFLLDQEADGHDFDAVGLEGDDLLVHHGGGGIHAQHEGQVGAIDVGVHDADAFAHLGERHGKVHRHRALPHAALARRHGNDATEVRVGHRLGDLRGRLGSGVHDGEGAAHATRGWCLRLVHGWRCGRRRAARRRGFGLRGVAHINADIGHACERLDGLSYVTHQRCVIGGGQQKRESDLAVNSGGDIPHHVGGQNVGAGTGVADGGEGAGDPLHEWLHWRVGVSG